MALGRAGRLVITGAVFCLNVAAIEAVAACSPEIPSFASISNSARTIALLEVIDSHGSAQQPSHYDLKLVSQIKGVLPDTFTVAAPVTSACGDRLAVRPGSSILMAFDVRVADQLINPVWELDATGMITLATGPYEEGDNIVAIINRLRPPIPSESTVNSASPQSDIASPAWWPPALILLVVLAGSIIGLNLMNRRRPS